MTNRRSPSSMSQGTTSPLTQDRVTRRGTGRRRGASRRSFTTAVTPPLLHQETTTTMTRRKRERLIKTTLLTILACRTILMLICYQLHLGNPLTLMEKIILSGVIKCVVIYSLSILASGKLLKMNAL
jgi:DNA integrity scanning protein DisA with diadenylate cyclase activity